MFPTENLSELCRCEHSKFSDEEAFYAKRNRTLWNSFVNSGVVIVDKRDIDEGIVQYTLAAPLHQNQFNQNESYVSPAEKRTLFDVWFWWIAELLILDGASDDKLWVLCSEGWFFADRELMCTTL